MGFAWVLVAAMIIETIILAWLMIIMRKGNRDFEKYLETVDRSAEELPQVTGSRYSGFLEHKQVTTKRELYELLEQENVGEWNPYSLGNVLRMVMLTCSVIASFLFVIIVIVHPEMTEAHIVILFAAYTGWFGFLLYSRIIRTDKERSAIAVRALMKAGRVKFQAMDLPG